MPAPFFMLRPDASLRPGFGIQESGFGKKEAEGQKKRIGGRALDPNLFLKPDARSPEPARSA